MSFAKRIHEFTVRLGQRSPRLQGLMFVAMGLALLGMNVALVLSTERFYMALNILGLTVAPMGLWILGTGRTYVAGLDKPPLWWSVGMYSFAFSGLAFGLYLSMWLRE